MENFIVYLENKGLAGMEEIFDSGWGYILPNAPYRLYEVLKRTQGNQNTESWNGYKRLRMQTRLDDAAIATSIQFLVLLGFITYKSGTTTQTSNHYSVTDFVNLLALQEVSSLEHLLNKIKAVRKASSSPKQSAKFNKYIEIMEGIISRFKKGEIELIPSEFREKILSSGETRVVRGIGGDADFFERYEYTLKVLQDFLEALFGSFRTGVNIPVQNCKKYCKANKCKCVEEITSSYSLMAFLWNRKTCTEQYSTCSVHDTTCTGQEGTSTVQNNNKIDNKPYNEINNIDEEFSSRLIISEKGLLEKSASSKPFSQMENSSSNTHAKLFVLLENELKTFFKADELASYNKLVNKAINLSVLEIETCLQIINEFKNAGYPVEAASYFPLVFANPDLNKARNAVEFWKKQVAIENSKKQKQVNKEARQATGRDYYEQLFTKINSEQDKEVEEPAFDDLPY